MMRNDREYDDSSNRLHGLFMGFVKNSSDYQRMGRLDVWIPELCSSDTETIAVVYGSPFAGASAQQASDDGDTYEETQKSYGFWAVPPDIDSIVLVMFINGHISRGVWLGGLFHQDMNHMVPNIPVGESYQKDFPAPTAEYNKKSANSTKDPDQAKPYHKPHYEAIRNQGLKNDPIRGFSQHGSRSENTSKVMGLLSPRGHYWSIEDTQNDEKIRLRSRGGVQLLLDDTNGMAYLINKSGKGWVEIDNEGKIMVYGEEGIALRSKKDINLRADNDLIFESGRNIVMKSVGNTKLENYNYIHKTKKNQSINVEGIQRSKLGRQHTLSEDDIQIVATNKYNIGTDLYNVNSSSNANITSGADLNINTVGLFNATSGGDTNLNSSGNTFMSSGSNMFLDASLIMENVGSVAQTAESAESSSPNVVDIPDLETYAKTDVIQPHSDEEPEENTIQSINTVFPSHEPCPEHGKTPKTRND